MNIFLLSPNVTESCRELACLEVGRSAYCVCRKDQEHVYATTTTEYSDLIRPYVMAKINASQGTTHEVH